MMNPSTAASRMVRAASARCRESGIRRRPVGSRSIPRATPRDHAGAAGAQPACGGIRAGVAELLGGVEHAPSHIVGDELRATECLRSAADGHARPLRYIAQPNSLLRHEREWYALLN